MDASSSFVHLHLHTHYSLLDGATRIAPLIQRAKDFRMPAVAITDHGNMFGAVEFYSACRKAGIKPIIGCEAYLAFGSRFSKEGGETKEFFHLLLLAMNLDGYRNLMRLSTIGYREGFYRKPRIDKEILAELSSGLLCTSTCLGGEIPQALMHRDRKTAMDLAKTYLSIFGPDRFFIELQDHGIPEQQALNPELADMAKELGVATIATNDVHYLDHADAEAHDVLCCINTGSLLHDENRFKFPTDQFYFKSGEEMAALFPKNLDAVGNTSLVAEMCNLELELNKRHAPVFHPPVSAEGSSEPAPTDGEYLRRLVYAGAAEKYGTITDELRDRIDYELSVITGKGFASYFLIVWDCVDFAKKEGIPISARGSGCSSVAAYCLGISTPDPIRYGLYFERFMDPDRDEMPDIDLDICQNGRVKVIDYVRRRFGHVAQIITFGTLKAKAVIKDVARVIGLSFDEANQLTRLVPSDLHITLDKALRQEPELKRRYETDPKVRRIVDIGRRLEGVARNAGVHAAGVVVADQDLVNFLPLYKASGQDSMITQFDGPTVEKVGLLKMDFLGLRTLTILERARQLAQRTSGSSINLTQLTLTDPRVYELFVRGDTRGIFQFESGGMRDVIMRIKPNRIEDLIAANALYRPGPMEYIPDYVARKHGARWTTPHPIMTELLQETYGIMVYQEQVSRIVNRLGGIELKSAFRLAKAISKKKTDMIEAMREPFLSGCAVNGVRRETAERVFEDILRFGGYAFNKAHSTGYALVAFQTAWMKTYFPVEFMAALMTFELGSIEKVAEYRDACQSMGIAVLPPDINRSEFDFIVESSSNATPAAMAAVGNAVIDRKAPDREATPRKNGVIRFGLGAIKGVGEKAVASIVMERTKSGPYRDLVDFCERVDPNILNKGCVEALVCAGGFDRTGAMRKAMFHAVERAIAAGQETQRDRRMGQLTMFENAPDPAAPYENTKAFSLGDDQWSEAEMLAKEKAVLGFYITKHPLADHEALINALSTLRAADLAKRQEGERHVLGGMITSVRTVVSKSGQNAGRQLGVITLEDATGRIEVVVFPDEFARSRSALTLDSVVFLEGEVDRKREEPSFRASRVIPLDSAVETLARSVVLTIRDTVVIGPLCELVRECSGKTSLFINVETADHCLVQMSSDFRVRCDRTFLREVKILGPMCSVKIVGPSGRSIPLNSSAFAA